MALAPPSTNVTAASDCAIAIAPVRLGKKPGEAAASIQQQMIGALGHRRGDGVRDRDQLGAGTDAPPAPIARLRWNKAQSR